MTSWPLPLQACNLCLMQLCMGKVHSTVICKGLGALSINGKDCIRHDVAHERSVRTTSGAAGNIRNSNLLVASPISLDPQLQMRRGRSKGLLLA